MHCSSGAPFLPTTKYTIFWYYPGFSSHIGSNTHLFNWFYQFFGTVIYLLRYISFKSGTFSSLLFLFHLYFTFLQNASTFHVLDLSGTFPSLSLFLSIALFWTKVVPFYHFVYFLFNVLSKLFLSEQKWNLSITFVLFYSPNIHFLSHICLFALEIKWNLFVTCSTLPNYEPKWHLSFTWF